MAKSPKFRIPVERRRFLADAASTGGRGLFSGERWICDGDSTLDYDGGAALCKMGLIAPVEARDGSTQRLPTPNGGTAAYVYTVTDAGRGSLGALGVKQEASDE